MALFQQRLQFHLWSEKAITFHHRTHPISRRPTQEDLITKPNDQELVAKKDKKNKISGKEQEIKT